MIGLLDVAPRWHYLGVLAVCVLCTLPLEWGFGAQVYRRPRRLLRTLAVVGVPFLVADWAAVQAGWWSFSARHTLGLHLPGGVPVEEALFFAVIPVCGLLTYGAVSGPRWRHRLHVSARRSSSGEPAVDREPVVVGDGGRR